MSKIRVDESMIHGPAAPAFREVEVEFKRNFAPIYATIGTKLTTPDEVRRILSSKGNDKVKYLVN